MASHGIKDRIAIIGMGCTNFVEHWDKSIDDLIVDAAAVVNAALLLRGPDLANFVHQALELRIDGTPVLVRLDRPVDRPHGGLDGYTLRQ